MKLYRIQECWDTATLIPEEVRSERKHEYLLSNSDGSGNGARVKKADVERLPCAFLYKKYHLTPGEAWEEYRRHLQAGIDRAQKELTRLNTLLSQIPALDTEAGKEGR